MITVLFYFYSYKYGQYNPSYYIALHNIIQNSYLLTKRRFLTVYDSFWRFKPQKHGLNQFMTLSCHKQVFDVKNPTLIVYTKNLNNLMSKWKILMATIEEIIHLYCNKTNILASPYMSMQNKSIKCKQIYLGYPLLKTTSR